MRYIVSTPWGTFKRTAARDYRFLVIVCGQDEAVLRARIERTRQQLEQSKARYQLAIETGARTSSQWDRFDQYPKHLADVTRQLEGLDGRLAEILAQNADRIAAQRGHYFAWTSRRDLADTQMRRALKGGFVNVHIYSCVETAVYTLSQEVA